jgi:hypothetical protein
VLVSFALSLANAGPDAASLWVFKLVVDDVSVGGRQEQLVTLSVTLAGVTGLSSALPSAIVSCQHELDPPISPPFAPISSANS